ncbi:hypothetical protein, partial [Lutibacter sp.]
DVSNAHFFWAMGDVTRSVWWRNHFTNMQHGTVGNDNTGPVFVSATDSDKENIMFKDNLITNINNRAGGNGHYFDVYRTKYLLIEGNTAENTVTGYGFWAKATTAYVTLRDNTAINNVSGYQLSVGNAQNNPHDHEVSWNRVIVPGTTIVFSMSSSYVGQSYNNFIYRNTFLGSSSLVRFPGREPYKTDGNIVISRTDLSWRSWNESMMINQYEPNILFNSNTQIIDSNARLLDSYRDQYFGKKGYELNLNFTPTLYVCEALPGSSCYYIAPDGNDTSGTGSFSNPYKTFFPITNQLQPGDFVYFKEGTYDISNTFTTDKFSISDLPCQSGEFYAENRCFYKIKSFIGLNSLSSWPFYDGSSYSVVDGTFNKPITVKAYPNSKVILNLSSLNESRTNLFIDRIAVMIGISNVVIEGFEIIGGIINIRGGINQNITIKNNIVHDVTVHGGDNPGLIRINRGYSEGDPKNIYIINNTLYNLFDRDEPEKLWKPNDYVHFSGVTILSKERYIDGEIYKGGTKYVEIKDNTFYNLPSFLFFKNPMEGPILVQNNTFKNAVRIATLYAGNVNFLNNLIANVSNEGFYSSGSGLETPELDSIKNINSKFLYNTFIDINWHIFYLYPNTNLFIKNNIFYGFEDLKNVNNWNADRFFNYDKDIKTDLKFKELYSDNNCIISKINNFLYLRNFVGTDKYDYSLSDLWSLNFSFESHSQLYTEPDISNVFNSDYSLKSAY